MSPTADTANRAPRTEASTRQQQVVDTLRDWAVTGQLSTTEKFSEAALADRLGVSRTPIRHAVAVLVEEGVLQRAGGRGYVVRSYDAADIASALEMRAMIEGLAARKAAEAGLSQEMQAAFADCLAEGDALFAAVSGNPVNEARYAAMNDRFHGLVMQAAGTPMMMEVRQVLDRVPYGAPSAIRFEKMGPQARALHLQHAHMQHHYIVAAILAGQAARAESLFRDHGEMIKISLGLAPGPWPREDGPGLPIALG